MIAAAVTFLWTMGCEPDAPMPNVHPAPATGYMDDVVRAGVVATPLWGVVGFLAGTYIAFKLAFPVLNWDMPWTSFGRLRPLHTSAVIFAFGGNALIATSFYVVQRTCAARLWGGNLPWWVLGLPARHRAGGDVLRLRRLRGQGIRRAGLAHRPAAEDRLGRLSGRLRRHADQAQGTQIYVANWCLLSSIVTVAMLHVVRNASVPVSIWGSTRTR